MNPEETDNKLSEHLSTYGVITSERILGQYKINLPQSDLVAATTGPNSFYHHLLQIPLRNVLNGIILQQTNDYHIYVQKLFIDYLLSGESSKDEESQGAATREHIEKERQQLVDLGDEFHQSQAKHDMLIGTSQNALIKITQGFNAALESAISSVNSTLQISSSDAKSKIRQAINYALIHCKLKETDAQNATSLFIESMNAILKVSLNEDIKKKMVNDLSKILQIVMSLEEETGDYLAEAKEISQLANSFRNQFYETTLRVVELIKLLPDYTIDPEQDEINREPLYFDNTIGSL